jgi:aspartyl-tRNA(Asn)/glutamyl-tRNA(Gln) amidotransferase subunit A
MGKCYADVISIIDFVKDLTAGKFTAVRAAEFYLDKCKSSQKNSVLEVFDDAVEIAKKIDEKIANGRPVGRLAGVPVIIKDNILYKGHTSFAAGKILAGFVSPYSATVVEKLLAEDAVIIARANQDEFAFGSTGSNSAYGMTKNGLNDDYVSGGSSSGSASAVAEGICLAALGTDTGGSIRCPASFNGIVGFKPTYGTVSRSGLIAFASSIEQCGPITKTAADNELLYDIICGKDPRDATTVANKTTPTRFDITKLRIGRIKEIWELSRELEQIDQYNEIFDFFKSNGATVIDVSIKNITLSLAGYYTVATAEAASNLSRFDGVKYGKFYPDADNIIDLYKNTRSRYFGAETKRRIMTGNYNLGVDNFATYRAGTEVFADVKAGFAKVFEITDCVLIPTTFGPAPRTDDNITDPVQLYLMDLFTVPANIAGVPALSVPCGTASNGMPIGLQIICKKFDDKMVFEIGKFLETRYRPRIGGARERSLGLGKADRAGAEQAVPTREKRRCK